MKRMTRMKYERYDMYVYERYDTYVYANQEGALIERAH